MIDHGFGVKFRRINPDDSARLYSWRNDPRIYRFCRQFEPIHRLKHDEWIARQAGDPTLSMFVIVESDIAVGVTGLTSIDRHNRSAEFSLYIDPERHGYGCGTRGLKTLLTHGFKAMGLHTIWGESFGFNPARKLFEALGMTCDGFKREAYYREGKWTDAYLYTMTESDWLKQLPSWQR